MEVSGPFRHEILDFFTGVDGHGMTGNLHADGSTVTSNDWRVTISPQTTKQMGALELPLTILEIEADDDIFDDLLHAYRMRFLSAGG